MIQNVKEEAAAIKGIQEGAILNKINLKKSLRLIPLAVVIWIYHYNGE